MVPGEPLEQEEAPEAVEEVAEADREPSAAGAAEEAPATGDPDAPEVAEEYEDPAEEAEDEKEDPYELERLELEAAITEAKKIIRPKMGNAKGKRGGAAQRTAGDASAEGDEEFLDAEEGADEDGPKADDSELQVPALSRDDWPRELARLEAMGDDEEKIEKLLEALGQRVEDARTLEEDHVVKNRRLAEATRERDRCIGEVSRTNQAKVRLESSCREFQQKKTSIAKENTQIAEEERNRHTELKDKFEQAMKDVQEKMDAELEVRQHFLKENEELRGKLQKFTETYEEQEKQLAEQRDGREKEMEVASKRLQEHESMCAKSKVKAAALEKHNEVLRKSQTVLRAELQSILNKFDECHEAVTGSNQRHGECKVEIDTLQTRLQDLEKEHADLRNNVEVTNMIEEQKVAQKQRDALEKLCGNLQKEIKQLQGEVKKGQKK